MLIVFAAHPGSPHFVPAMVRQANVRAGIPLPPGATGRACFVVPLRSLVGTACLADHLLVRRHK